MLETLKTGFFESRPCGDKSHPTDWRSRRSNQRSRVYKVSGLSTTPSWLPVQCALTIQIRIALISIKYNNEPVHEISNNVVCATSKASDQPAHMRSLIRAFASRLSIIRLLSY